MPPESTEPSLHLGERVVEDFLDLAVLLQEIASQEQESAGRSDADE